MLHRMECDELCCLSVDRWQSEIHKKYLKAVISLSVCACTQVRIEVEGKGGRPPSLSPTIMRAILVSLSITHRLCSFAMIYYQ